VIEERAGAVEDAEAIYKSESLIHLPSSPSWHLEICIKGKRWREAQKQFQAAIELAPKNPCPGSPCWIYLILARKQMLNRSCPMSSNSARGSSGIPTARDYYIARVIPREHFGNWGTLCAASRDAQVQKTYIQLLILIIGSTKQPRSLTKVDSSSQDAEHFFLKDRFRFNGGFSTTVSLRCSKP